MDSKDVGVTASGLSVVPDGCLAVTPWVIVDGAADFLDFAATVFDAQEVLRMPAADGRRIGHAETRIGGVPVMAFDSSDNWPATPAFLRVYTADCDETVRRAVDAGSRVVTEPTTVWIGDRVARFTDPWNNLWWVHTRVAEPTMDELKAGPPDQAAVEAMQYLADSLEAEMTGPRR